MSDRDEMAARFMVTIIAESGRDTTPLAAARQAVEFADALRLRLKETEQLTYKRSMEIEQ